MRAVCASNRNAPPPRSLQLPKPSVSLFVSFLGFYKLEVRACKNSVPSRSRRTTHLGSPLSRLYNECLHSLAPKCYLRFPKVFLCFVFPTEIILGSGALVDM